MYLWGLLFLVKILQASAYDADVRTVNNNDYTCYPVDTNNITFYVLAPHNAHVALYSHSNFSATPSYEIFFGASNNTNSAIRKTGTEQDVCSTETPDLLRSTMFRGLWIKWDQEQTISLGISTNETDPLLNCNISEVLTVQYMCVRTTQGAIGFWMLKNVSGEAVKIGSGAQPVHWALNGTIYELPPRAYTIYGPYGSMVKRVGRAFYTSGLIPGDISRLVTFTNGVGQNWYEFDTSVPCWGRRISENYTILTNFTGYLRNCNINNEDCRQKALPVGMTNDGEPIYVGKKQAGYEHIVSTIQLSNNGMLAFRSYGYNRYSSEYKVLSFSYR